MEYSCNVYGLLEFSVQVSFIILKHDMVRNLYTFYKPSKTTFGSK
jgi:hypothetical protein